MTDTRRAVSESRGMSPDVQMGTVGAVIAVVVLPLTIPVLPVILLLWLSHWVKTTGQR